MWFSRAAVLASVLALSLAPSLPAWAGCPNTEADKGYVVLVFPDAGYRGVLTQTLSLSAVYGSECVQPSQTGEDVDDVPPVIGPPASGDFPVGTGADVTGPWYELPPTNEQTRRIERYRRTANGGCT
jgi:hypothetical protein